jgi:hypothetical protein
MESTPSFFKEFPIASLTYAGLPLIAHTESACVNPNLVAKKMSFRFPVRLNLLRLGIIAQHRSKQIYPPLSNEFLAILVYVCGIPKSATACIDGIEDL